MSSDEMALKLLEDMEIYEKKEADIDSMPSICKNMNLIASLQPAEAIYKHLKLLILKLRVRPSAACLNIIKCYLELGRGDIYRYFVENDGFCAIGSSFEKMSRDERQIVCNIVAVILSTYDIGPMNVLVRRICKVPSPEMLKILGLCLQKSTMSFVFEDNYLEWLLQQAIKRDLGRQAVGFLIALNASSTLDQKIVIKYLLIKTDFFKHVSGAEFLKEEIKRTTPCRPVLSGTALDDRFKGILEIVDSLGLCNFIVFILESLLFEPERFLKDTEEKFIKPIASEKQNMADSREHPKTGECADNAFDMLSKAPENPGVAADVKPAPTENVCSGQEGVSSIAGKAGGTVHAMARGPPKRRSTKKDARKEMPDL